MQIIDGPLFCDCLRNVAMATNLAAKLKKLADSTFNCQNGILKCIGISQCQWAHHIYIT